MTVNRLETLRLNKGLSVRQAAEKIGIARATLQALENGETIHPAKAKMIADFYEVQVMDIWPVEEAA